MGVPRFDENDWPIVRVTYRQSMTAGEAKQFYERLAGYLKRNQRFALLFDARPADVPSAQERAQIAEFWKETAADSSRLLAGVAVVLKTPVGRGVISVVLWAYTPPFPVRAFSTLFDGEKWLRERLT
jgi:hypothetical protein